MLVCDKIIIIDLLPVVSTEISDDRSVGYQEPLCNLQTTTPLGHFTIDLINSSI